MELVEWLLAVLDEDERVARAAQTEHATPWRAGTSHVYDNGPDRVCDSPTWDGEAHCVDHIALHDPAAVLADIAAKRRLLNLCAEWQAMAFADPARQHELFACAKNTRRLLASAYAHRDGFDPSWA